MSVSSGISMIPLGRPQHLGRKTLVIMMLKGLLPCFILLFIVVILSFNREAIIAYFSISSSPLGSGDMTLLTNGIANFMPIIIPVIFFLGIILGGTGILVNTLQYQFFTFTLEEFGLKMKRGVFNVEEVTIPYRQMQDVDVTRPLIYRIFGLSRLVVFSAGHENPGEPETTKTVFDPIDLEIAEEIRILLGRRIGVQVIEHETEADQEEIEAKSRPALDL